jgi:hypothetical protein
MAIHITNFALKDFVIRTLCYLFETIDYAAHHPAREMHKRAIEESVQYINENMPNALGLYTPGQVIEAILPQVDSAGLILEFGVFRGGSIRYLARRMPGREIHGFDSFLGLPQAWTWEPKGAYNLGGRLPRVPKHVKLHPGFFEDSLPAFKKKFPGNIVLLHIDCDLYSSTKTVFDELGDRITTGTIILFDEYFGYPGWKNHEHKAFKELIESCQLRYTYLCYARRQVAVRIL